MACDANSRSFNALPFDELPFGALPRGQVVARSWPGRGPFAALIDCSLVMQTETETEPKTEMEVDMGKSATGTTTPTTALLTGALDHLMRHQLTGCTQAAHQAARLLDALAESADVDVITRGLCGQMCDRLQGVNHV